MDFIKYYPDRTSYVDLTSAKCLPITFRINTYEDLWHLHQYVDAYNRHFGETPVITIPNLLDAQADRIFSTSQSFGLKLICDFLNKMDATFIIYHPHNPDVVQALMSNVRILDNSDFVKQVIWNINGNYPKEKIYLNLKQDSLILMSSDAGGFKPLMKLCEILDWDGETFSASKARLTGHSEARLVQKVDREDFGGKDILIVDDISIYGGTFKGLAKMLRERNCGKLYLAVSHMTVQNLGQDPVTNYFDVVYTTNSKYDKYYGTDDFEPENLEIIKMF